MIGSEKVVRSAEEAPEQFDKKSLEEAEKINKRNEESNSEKNSEIDSKAESLIIEICKETKLNPEDERDAEAIAMILKQRMTEEEWEEYCGSNLPKQKKRNLGRTALWIAAGGAGAVAIFGITKGLAAQPVNMDQSDFQKAIPIVENAASSLLDEENPMQINYEQESEKNYFNGEDYTIWNTEKTNTINGVLVSDPGAFVDSAKLEEQLEEQGLPSSDKDIFFAVAQRVPEVLAEQLSAFQDDVRIDKLKGLSKDELQDAIDNLSDEELNEQLRRWHAFFFSDNVEMKSTKLNGDHYSDGMAVCDEKGNYYLAGQLPEGLTPTRENVKLIVSVINFKNQDAVTFVVKDDKGNVLYETTPFLYKKKVEGEKPEPFCIQNTNPINNGNFKIIVVERNPIPDPKPTPTPTPTPPPEPEKELEAKDPYDVERNSWQQSGGDTYNPVTELEQTAPVTPEPVFNEQPPEAYYEPEVEYTVDPEPIEYTVEEPHVVTEEDVNNQGNNAFIGAYEDELGGGE